MISVSDKKEFIKWFLNTYTLAKREVAWFMTYLSSSDKLLEKVHFVKDIVGLPKAIMMSTECVTMTPFKFYKNNRVTPDVETAFLDIRSNPEEDVYIGLFFKDRETSPEYAAVLEVNPMGKQNLVKDNFLELLAELVLDQAVREFNKERLYEAIDVALVNGDRKRFIELTNQLNMLLKMEDNG
ncbi:IDEAL domain protein [Vulcanibacillus modesticaldus]|uniref:IDEAL domain protein n=1 Tax=Vulcanibacillus modesticaldus TaxID=337097 RepID=A0A1D2YTN8_9BACI|nr:ReoY family proteolytic degradation factor [Vulcanibacillus modesticaldus]OEF99021.1 IDEAL domain protein [Vulcanibacillus modesticaldus]